RAFIAKHRVDYPVVRLDDERVIDAYAVPGLPTTVFIGADGIVTGKVVGGFVGPEGEKLLVSRLDRLLADTHPRGACASRTCRRPRASSADSPAGHGQAVTGEGESGRARVTYTGRAGAPWRGAHAPCFCFGGDRCRFA